MRYTGILRSLATVSTLGLVVAISPQALAIPPVIYSYYPIAAPGCATSLSPWRNGDTWITGCGSSGDNMVYELVRTRSDPETFQQRGFYAKQVAVDPASNTAGLPYVWAVTAAGVIYRYMGSVGWLKLLPQPACTRSIAVGAGQTVWIIQCDNTIAYLGASGTFISRGGGPETLSQVAVPLNGGNPWFVAQSGNIYYYSPGTTSWSKKPGCGTSIGIGSDGIPWITGCGSNSNGNVYRWNGSSFSQVVWNQQLNLKSIRVSYENIPWALGDGTTYPRGSIIERTAELDFKGANVPQVESNWCWVAAPQSIYNYLTNSTNLMQQCILVNGILGRSDCCSASQPCNQTGLGTTTFNYLQIRYTAVPNSPATFEGAEGVYAYGGIQYVERWNPLPVGIGTWETVTYPQYVTPTGKYTKETIDQLHF
jgi:hypothetical protein